MYFMPECTCGEELEFGNDEFFDGDNDVIVYQVYGYCPKCEKRYKWKDEYILTDFRDLEEIE